MRIKFICCYLSVFFISSVSAASQTELERVVQAQGQLLTDFQQRVTDLQQEVDLLRGELQESTYLLSQTVERQKMILQQLNDITEAKTTTPAVSQATANNSTTLVGWSPTGNDKTDYNFIIKFILAGQQSKEAIKAFQLFVTEYPKSSYQSNVNYWLGQLCYGQGRKDDASYYYAIVVKNYPKSNKAAESLYKVGLILSEQNEKEKAKAVWQQVISQYPKDKAIVDQAKQKLADLSA